MLVSRPGSYSPIKQLDTKPVGTTHTDRSPAPDARFDSLSLSDGAYETDSVSFRQLVSSLSQQVRTCNTTGKIQQLHSQVQSGQYTISPADIAARMLLLEEGV